MGEMTSIRPALSVTVNLRLKTIPQALYLITENLKKIEERGSRVRFPAGAGNFSLRRRVQNGSGDRPASYPMGTRGSFLGGKAAGSQRWPLTSI
jgi:hypothetical protein